MQKLLTAASTLEKLAEGEEVDPKALRDLAKSIREADASVKSEMEEAKGGKGEQPGDISGGSGAGSDDELEKNGSSDVKVGLDQLGEAGVDNFGGKKAPPFKKGGTADDPDNDGDADGDDDNDGDGKKTVTVTESNKDGKGNLREADVIELKAKYPSIYAVALREATSTVGSDIKKLQTENSSLRAEKLIRESLGIGRRKLTESKLPEGAFDRMLQQMVGLTESEMDDVIAAESKYLESVGLIGSGKRVGGNGERITVLRESGDVATTTNAVLAGLTGD